MQSGYEYISKYESRKKRIFRSKAKKILFSFFGGLVVICFLLVAVWKNNIGQTNIIISPLAESINASVDAVKNIVIPSKLDEIVSKSLAGTKGSYAIAIKNLKTNESYYLNEHKEFETASLYKLWIMTVAYQQMEKGGLDFDKIISKDIAELNDKFDISSESAELTDGKFEMSIRNAINQMITISHNYAALSVSEEIRLSNVSGFLKNYGFKNSRVGSPPTTTAADVSVFFEKLYKKEFASEKVTEEMVKLLTSQQINDRIPKYLPEEIKTAHKTGELNGFKHDAGIIFAKKGDYILVILSESDNPKAAAEREALLSKAVYEYFENR